MNYTICCGKGFAYCNMTTHAFTGQGVIYLSTSKKKSYIAIESWGYQEIYLSITPSVVVKDSYVASVW